MDRNAGGTRRSAGASGKTAGGVTRTGARRSACALSGERSRLAALEAIELDLRGGGVAFVAGVDEVGRGSLAGPVVAAAVILPEGARIGGLDDSKVLSPEVREDVDRRVRRVALAFGIGAASASEIDAQGIAPATFLAMRRALAALSGTAAEPGFVLVDGAAAIPGLPLPQRAVVKGDGRVACIAAASVVAKVERDRLMEGAGREFPWYGFSSHKGYGSAEHLEALRRHGPCPLHRLSFRGVLGGAAAGTVAAA